jgi:hypothetical protein
MVQSRVRPKGIRLGKKKMQFLTSLLAISSRIYYKSSMQVVKTRFIAEYYVINPYIFFKKVFRLKCKVNSYLK